jgi:pimeloyl-ACP methyl ester carboxylesterase
MPSAIVSFPSDQWLLTGCVHLPDDDPSLPRIGVIILVDMIKFGPHGLFRQLADAFAASGFYALRYENRGTCDSPGDCALSFDDRIADACAATQFFATEYKLDQVLFWGLCMGGAVATHVGVRLSGSFRPVGMVLCSLPTDACDATLPELNYLPTTFSAYLRSGLNGSPWNKLREFLFDKDYRSNILKSIATLARNHLRSSGRLRSNQIGFSRVGPLLAQYDGPRLIVYGDTDQMWATFTQRANPGDKLGLSRMKSPPQIVLVADGDHTFRSVQQTSEVIRLSVSWAAALRDGQTLAGHRDELDAIFA